MSALVQQIIIGIRVAAALSIPIGYGLARSLANESAVASQEATERGLASREHR
jgi:hypothetical protein